MLWVMEITTTGGISFHSLMDPGMESRDAINITFAGTLFDLTNELTAMVLPKFVTSSHRLR